ncbi:hypothetical protein cyc_01128 [Cyclospora cayetanensis]|uniref:Uncharacterized protein n=1 Tax=Cyclospora cayetanensis TaxID=88456 RepID=A0A1D3CYK8_9EIME|nr:hypothetical protein cyc_01128 [Cyclospora cayetanensis]
MYALWSSHSLLLLSLHLRVVEASWQICMLAALFGRLPGSYSMEVAQKQLSTEAGWNSREVGLISHGLQYTYSHTDNSWETLYVDQAVENLQGPWNLKVAPKQYNGSPVAIPTEGPPASTLETTQPEECVSKYIPANPLHHVRGVTPLALGTLLFLFLLGVSFWQASQSSAGSGEGSEDVASTHGTKNAHTTGYQHVLGRDFLWSIGLMITGLENIFQSITNMRQGVHSKDLRPRIEWRLLFLIIPAYAGFVAFSSLVLGFIFMAFGIVAFCKFLSSVAEVMRLKIAEFILSHSAVDNPPLSTDWRKSNANASANGPHLMTAVGGVGGGRGVDIQWPYGVQELGE